MPDLIIFAGLLAFALAMLLPEERIPTSSIGKNRNRRKIGEPSPNSMNYAAK